MTLFEVYSFQILEHLSTFFSHITDGFTKLHSQNSPHSQARDLFADTYRYSLLKASITIAQLFLKFLTVEQLEVLIVNAILTSDQERREDDLVMVVLDTVSKEAKNHPKLLVQACFNSYSKVTEQDSSPRLNAFASRYFGQLLCPMLSSLPKEFIGEHSKKLLRFLKESLALPYHAESQGLSVSSEIEGLIVQCVQAFVVKLNEE